MIKFSSQPSVHLRDPARFYTDLSTGYRFKLFGDKVRTKVPLNVKNAFDGGRLQPIAINPDGKP